MNSNGIKSLLKHSMANDLLKTVEKLFKLHVVDVIHPSSIIDSEKLLYSETENNVLQYETYQCQMGL